ncbi:hypothetical protein GCM10022226_30990 [Sphaerisporangium flaviroseum]|uniref:Uncharacterized protein n=1 Tax=Sphaerisporangium flaviroseum TaxID=509199 RepID=A0ABP7I3I2_9ACTN
MCREKITQYNLTDRSVPWDAKPQRRVLPVTELETKNPVMNLQDAGCRLTAAPAGGLPGRRRSV